MEYKYYNQFNLSNELSHSISSIISQKEKDNYVCKIITVTIPEHKGLVLHSPFDRYEPSGPGFLALHGAQIQAINEKFGYYTKGTIPAEEYHFFVVMKREELESFSKLSFDDRNKIKKTLQSHSVVCEGYFGIFDSRTLIQSFPYLQDFFNYLDEWRAETGRITIDSDVLEKGMKKTLSITKKALDKK